MRLRHCPPEVLEGHTNIPPYIIPAWLQVGLSLVSLELHLLAGPGCMPLPKIPRQAVLLDKIGMASGGLLLMPNWPPEDQSYDEQGAHKQIQKMRSSDELR